MAQSSGHEPVHAALSRLHRGSRPLRRRSRRGTSARGVGQYVILGAGLDTFAHRRPELASRLLVFEIDQPGPQEWKRQRLVDLGLGIPSFLRLVPVDFEAGDTWWERLAASGFDSARPAVVASTGVSMYLTKDAIAATLRRVAALAPGSTLAMSFMLPIELVDPEVRPGVERAAEGARASGTPFISFFTPTAILALARDAGFKEVQHVSAVMLAQRYFAGRTDGLRPPNNSEELLVANLAVSIRCSGRRYAPPPNASTLVLRLN